MAPPLLTADDGASAATTTATASSPTPRPLRIYHANSQVRINQLLETGRRRREAMTQSGQSLPTAISGSLSPLQTPVSHHEEPAGEATESSADEQTVMMMRENASTNHYQSTAATTRVQNSSAGSRARHGQRRNTSGDSSRSDTGWWKQQVEKYGAIELENKGSVARDHLALERTFLAWLRTSLAFASIGIAITQLFRLNSSISGGGSTADDPYIHLRQLGKPLGATFLGISIVVLWVGFHRYFESQYWIIRGKFPASRGSIAFVAGIAFLLMVVSLIVVLVVEPGKRK